MKDGSRILVTGSTGLVGLPLCRALASEHTVFAGARFRDRADAAELARLGVTPVPFDLSSDDWSALPDDVDVVFHLGALTPSTDVARRHEVSAMLEANAFATARLMSRFRHAKAFVFASSASVYAPVDRPLAEDDEYGVQEGFPEYSLSKIAAEVLVRHLTTEFGLPTVILRLFQMYGPGGGAATARIERVRQQRSVAIAEPGPNVVTVMFEDDYVDKLIASVDHAAVPVAILNFGGSATSVEELCTKAAEILGVEPKWSHSAAALVPRQGNLEKMERFLGPASVTLDEGIRRVVEAGPSGFRSGWASFAMPGEQTEGP